MVEGTTDPPVWFITGCLSGFGWSLSPQHLLHWFPVVATARDPKKLGSLIAGMKTRRKCSLWM